MPLVEEFIGSHPSIIAGSTWPEDEAVLKETVEDLSKHSLKLVIAPHEITEAHIASIIELFPNAVRYSQLDEFKIQNLKFKILIVDNIGMLSRLYKYATITYVGGGFGKGIHNILEAAVYGKPVLFGPVFHKFREAKDLIHDGGAKSIANAEKCRELVEELLLDKEVYKITCEDARKYVYDNRGATQKILNYIQEKRLLIN